MTQAYREYRAEMMKAYPYAISRFSNGKWRYFARTDNPDTYLETYRKIYEVDPTNIRITDSRTKKVVYQN